MRFLPNDRGKNAIFVEGSRKKYKFCTKSCKMLGFRKKMVEKTQILTKDSVTHVRICSFCGEAKGGEIQNIFTLGQILNLHPWWILIDRFLLEIL